MPHSLWQAICEKENFYEAWKKVRANLGAPGLDKVTVIDFEANLDENLDLILQTVKMGSYQPLPYLSFKIKKESAGSRELKILTVRDRIVNEAVLLQLQPIYEKIFNNCSYAYRPKRSAIKAVDRVERNIKRGRHWVFDADIKDFFGNIYREILLKIVGEKITDKKVLKLIEIMVQAEKSPGNIGIAQGAPLSPLLSNIYLHSFDDTMIRAEWNYVRFSDNLVALCNTKEEAETAFTRAKEFLSSLLKLDFNQEKTKIVNASDGFDFLGYHFDVTGKKPCDASMKKMQTKIESAIKGAGSFTVDELKSKLDSIIRGWLNYFQIRTNNYQKLFDELEKKWQEQGGSISENIFLAALAISIGKRESAEETMAKIPIEDFNDADIYFQWGILNELLDRENEAVDAYHSAYRLNTEHADAAYRLGVYFLNQGNMEKALRFLQKSVQLKPDWGQAQFSLAIALKKFNLDGAARKAFFRAYELDPSLKKKALPDKSYQKNKTYVESFQFNNENVQLMNRLFSGREGVFARQWCDKTGRSGYLPVHRHLNSQELKNHLTGRETLGLYLLRSDNTVNFLTIDIDISKQIRSEKISENYSQQRWEEMAHVEAVSIQKLAQKLGISGYIENSGHKGRHVWLFFSEPVPAREAIAFAKNKIAEKGATPPGLTMEIFPKEPRVGAKGLGSLIKMPLGIHKLTGKRCFFLEANGKQFSDQWYVVQNVKKINRTQFEQAFDKLKTGNLNIEQDKVDVSEIDKMVEKCNVLKYLVEKAEKEHHLAHVDRLTILHTIGHFKEAGKYFIHKIIGKTYNYDYRITERWIKRLKGSPVSCPKIRDWQSHITPAIGCYCKFPDKSKCYPTPILHIKPDFVFKKQVPEQPVIKEDKGLQQTKHFVKKPEQEREEQSNTEIMAADKKQVRLNETIDLDIENLVADFIELNQQVNDITEKKQKIELKLETMFNKKNKDRLDLKMGVLRRVKEGDGFKYLIEI